jgi:hypothetical protein
LMIVCDADCMVIDLALIRGFLKAFTAPSTVAVHSSTTSVRRPSFEIVAASQIPSLSRHLAASSGLLVQKTQPPHHAVARRLSNTKPCVV